MSKPLIAITIGFFDGVHLGHQALLAHMRKRVGPKGKVVVVTFANHPREFFHSDTVVKRLCSAQERRERLKRCGVDQVIEFAFDSVLASTSAEDFLRTLKTEIPFTHIILGKGARLGKNQEGDEGQIGALQSKLGFTVEYLPLLTAAGKPVSSGHIRSLLEKDRSGLAEILLTPPS